MDIRLDRGIREIGEGGCYISQLTSTLASSSTVFVVRLAMGSNEADVSIDFQRIRAFDRVIDSFRNEQTPANRVCPLGTDKGYQDVGGGDKQI